jgi:hypothetical protein
MLFCNYHSLQSELQNLVTDGLFAVSIQALIGNTYAHNADVTSQLLILFEQSVTYILVEMWNLAQTSCCFC